MREYVEAARRTTIQNPSVLRAEFQREIDEISELRKRVRDNIEDENMKQRQKIAKLKAQYDREGVEFVEEGTDLGRQVGEGDGIPPEQRKSHPSYQKQQKLTDSEITLEKAL